MKLKVLNSFEEKRALFEEREKELQKSHPLKGLKKLPNMPGVTKETARYLRLKSLIYLIRHDEKRLFLRYFFKRPIRYGLSLIQSYMRRKSYLQEGDFFLFSVKSMDEFEKKLEDKKALFFLGFSYCHKPFECPSGRFTDECIRDEKSPVCGQCFIGKCANLAPSRAQLLFIPTVHYIGEKMMEARAKYPKKEIYFMITACEMSLKMFADWGNMLDIQGVGVRLDGRICNTMRAFELSERGIKPGLTLVLDETQERMLKVLSKLNQSIDE